MKRPAVEHHLLHKSRLEFSNAVAALIVVREDERYLMQLRDDKPGIFYPDHWGLFGGAVEEGETPEDALRRELDEELGFVPEQLTYFTDLDFDVSTFGLGRRWRKFYEVSIAVAQLDRLRLGEGQKMEAVPVSELLVDRRVVPYDSFAIWLHQARGNWTVTA